MGAEGVGNVSVAVLVAVVSFAVGGLIGFFDGQGHGKHLAYDDRCSAVGGHLEAERICVKGDSVLWTAYEGN